MKRRSLLLGGMAGALGLGAMLRPRDKGENHSPYFIALSEALDGDRRSGPTLVVDRQRILANVATLKSHVAERFDYRIVAKSLPSLPLLKETMAASGSDRLMLFHQPFINQVARELPQADVLLGQPMPVAAAATFYRQFEGGAFDPSRQLCWLLDSPARVAEYAALAASLQQAMPVCIEIDVGLHRGGVNSDEDLVAMLNGIEASAQLQFRGFMGYEPHVVKVPGHGVNALTSRSMLAAESAQRILPSSFLIWGA